MASPPPTAPAASSAPDASSFSRRRGLGAATEGSPASSVGELLSREEGKPLAEGKGEIYRAGQFFTYYAAECLRQIGDTAS